MASDPSMQYTLFWRVEKLARLMNSELTPAEREGLLAHHNGVPIPVARDLKKGCANTLAEGLVQMLLLGEPWSFLQPETGW